MAINTEDPEEGTPKSKKDIRRERRQMKEVDRYRKSIGAEPLYSKEERRAVGKIVEPGKSKVMTEADSSAQVKYNDPNKPAEYSEFEYKKYEPGGVGVPSKETKTPVTQEQFQTIISDNPKEGEIVKQTILNNAYTDPNATPNTIKTAQEVANVAKDETNNLVNKVETEVKEELDSTPKVGGSGETVSTVVNGVDPNATNWVNVTNYGEGYQFPSEESIIARANLAKKKAPSLVVEKLGVQDYYPEIGRDIAVGTFTGSRIGSQTIYSGAGGLLPLGLYDARKRAIAADIKKKQALMSELSEIPDISKQFQPYFSAKYVEGLNKFTNAYKDNPEGLMNDPEFRKYQAVYKGIAENFLKVSDDLEEFEKFIQPGDKGADKGGYGAYATPGMLEILYKFKAGFLPDKVEDWFNGKKNISTLTETVRAIPNGYKIIGEKINDLLKTNQIERTIKPKTGEEIDWTKAKDEIDSVAQQVKDGSTDYESYLTVVKKYYDIDVKPLVEQFVNGNSLGALTEKEKKEYINSLTLYAEAQIPAESMISKIDRQTNDNSENYRAQLDYNAQLAKIGWEREKWEREQAQNPTNALIDAAMQSPDGSFTQYYSQSNGNRVPLSSLKVDVYDKNGNLIKGMSADKLRGGEYYSGPNKTGRIDIKSNQNEIVYQPTQGRVNRVGSSNDYVYSNSGVGFVGTSTTDKNGNAVTQLTGLGVKFYRPEIPAVQNGNKLGTTIIDGNASFGQTANEQNTTIRTSGSNSSYNRN